MYNLRQFLEYEFLCEVLAVLHGGGEDPLVGRPGEHLQYAAVGRAPGLVRSHYICGVTYWYRGLPDHSRGRREGCRMSSPP